MIRQRLSIFLSALVPFAAGAGILIDSNGKALEGIFSIDSQRSLVFRPDNGSANPVLPGSFQALEVDTKDLIWPAAFRSSAKVEMGLLGTYYERTNLQVPKHKRVDFGIDFNWGGGGPFKDWRVDHFSVRWTGTFQVEQPGEYEFITTSDDGVRLEIDGKKLINNWTDHNVIDNKAKIKLAKDKEYRIRIEYFENSGEAIMRVGYIGPDKKRHSLKDLLLAPPSDVEGNLDLPILGDTGLKPGIVLRDGTVLNAKVKQANDTAFILGAPFDDLQISTFNVARVVFRTIPVATAAAARSGRKGALLVGGDFVDGEFKSFERGILKLSSLLFGFQTLETKYETHAVMIREPKADRAAWRVRDYKGNVLMAESIRFEGNDIVVTSPILKDVRLPLANVFRIDTGTGSELYPASLQLGPESVHAKKKVSLSDDDRRRADSLKRLAYKEKSKLLQKESLLRKTIHDEKEKLLDAKESEAGYQAKVDQAKTEHAKAAADYQTWVTKYEAALKASNQEEADYRTADQKYTRAKSNESRAYNSVRSRQREFGQAQSNYNRYRNNKDTKVVNRFKTELEKKQKAWDEAKAAHSQAQRDTREALDQRTQQYKVQDKSRRHTAKLKSERDSKKRLMDSRQRTLNYELGRLRSAQSKTAAALTKVENRKKDSLR